MQIVTFIFLVIAISICIFTLWAIKKLNIYIGRLETQIEVQLDRIDDLEDLLIQSNVKNKKVIRKNLIPEEDE